MSVIWGLGDEDTATAVVAAHEAGVDAALEYLESHACQVRRGHYGLDVQDASGFVAAAFRHRTSRAGDPALHTHVLLSNMAEGPDRRWTALDTRALYAHGRTAGFIYQAVLRHELASTLGVLFEEMERGYADVAGVPTELRDAFSVRRGQILKAMEVHGATSAAGAQAAALSTRAAKTEHLSEADLRVRWHSQAEAFGWSVSDLPRMARQPGLVVDDSDIAERLTESQAAFERRDVIRAVAQAATQGATLAEIEARTDAFLGGPYAIALNATAWTTPEILELEQATVSAAAAGRAAGVGVVSPDKVAAAIRLRPSLGTDQAGAVEAMCRSGDSLTVLIGVAGSGKTFCLDAARAAWTSDGYRVMGTALAARAALELTTDAGIASQTADRLLNSLAAGRETLDARTVVVIDEGGMLGTRRLAALVREADTAGSKVVLVGDAAQLPEIDAGGLFASLSRRLGHVELSVNRRQRDPEEVATAAELRARDPEAALSRMQRHGRLTTADNADLLRDAMVADWYEARGRGEEVLMLAARREVVADLNARARALLAQQGELGAPVAEVDEVAFSLGDEVMAHHNDYGLGILNAERGVVTGGSDAALTVAVGERSVLLPRAYIEEGNLTHSFAATIHKAQGLSVDRVFVLGDDSFTAEVGYTGLTRGREANHVYVVAPERPDGHGWEPALDPVEAFSAALARSGAKTAAIDHLGPDGGPAVVVEP